MQLGFCISTAQRMIKCFLKKVSKKEEVTGYNFRRLPKDADSTAFLYYYLYSDIESVLKI